MRTLLCALVLGLTVGLSGCKKQETAEAPEEPAAAPPAPKSETATPPPQPVALSTPAPAPATPAPELAPPGIFFLVTAVSLETADGILGLKPGLQLREVRPGVYRSENNEVTLRPDQVTNDLAVARRLTAQEQRNQAAIQPRVAPPSVSTTPSANAQTKPPAQDPGAALEEAKRAARTELLRQRAVIVQQSDQIGKSLNQYAVRFGSWEQAAKKSPQAFQLLQQYNAVLKQRNDIDAKIAQTR